MKAKKVAVVVSHPIQHFCPQYVSWSNLSGVDLRVFFASNHGLVPYYDKNFGTVVQWNDLLLDFPHEFLSGAEERELNNKLDSSALESSLRNFSPSVLLVYGYSQPLQRRAATWAKAAGIPIIMIADSELRSRRGLIKRIVKSIVLPRVLSKINVFMTVGDANEAYYRNYGVADTRMVRTFFPIDQVKFDQKIAFRNELRAKIRREFDIPSAHKVVLMVGKLVSWKRQIDLIEFSNRIQSTHSDITVVLAGTGADGNHLKNAAKKVGSGGVIFTGFISPEKLIGLYFAADVYAHCSMVEPHSLAISEAIYSGLPVVISDRCGSYGPTDDVRMGLNGFVYPCADIEALSDALLNVLNDSACLHRMSGASREIALANQGLAHRTALLQALEVVRACS